MSQDSAEPTPIPPRPRCSATHVARNGPAYMAITQRLVDPDPKAFHGESDDDTAIELSRQFEVFPRNCRHVGDSHHREYLDRRSVEARRLVKKHCKVIEKLAELLLQRKELEGGRDRGVHRGTAGSVEPTDVGNSSPVVEGNGSEQSAWRLPDRHRADPGGKSRPQASIDRAVD